MWQIYLFEENQMSLQLVDLLVDWLIDYWLVEWLIDLGSDL